MDPLLVLWKLQLLPDNRWLRRKLPKASAVSCSLWDPMSGLCLPLRCLIQGCWMLLVKWECLRKACVITPHSMAWRKGLETVRRLMWDSMGVTERESQSRRQR